MTFNTLLEASLPGRLSQRGERQCAVVAGIIIVAAGCAILYFDWSTARSVNTGFASLLPTWDSHRYLRCANYLLDRGGFGTTDLSASCNWRPIYSSIFSTLTGLGDRDLHVSLMLQAILIGLGLAALFRELLRWLGLLAAVAAFIPLWLYATRYGIPNVMTENSGLMFGSVALALLIRGAETKKPWLTFVGMAVLTLALNARAGCYFVLPALILWAGLYNRIPRHNILVTFVVAGLSVAAGFAINFALIDLNGVPLTESNANFSTTLYGLAFGGKGWAQAGVDHPGASDAEIYRLAVEEIIRQPAVFIGVLFGALIDCLKSALGLFGGYIRHLEPLFWALWVAGFAAIAAGWRDARYALIGAISIGSLLSGPFIFQDAAPRVFAATVPADATQMGLGVAFLLALLWRRPVVLGQRPGRIDSAVPAFALALAALFIAITFAPYTPLRRLAALPDLTAPACAEGDRTIVTRLGRETGAFFVVTEGEETRVVPPQASKSVLSRSATLGNLANLPAPYAFLLTYQRSTASGDFGFQYLVISTQDLRPLYGKTVRICARPDRYLTKDYLWGDVYFARSVDEVSN